MKKNRTAVCFSALLIILILSGCKIAISEKTGSDGTQDGPGIDTPVLTPDDISGFFVRDGKLYDANGYLFQMRGVNVNHNWNASGRDDESLYYESIPYIKATGANAVRIVFGPVENDPWSYQGITTEARRQVVEEYITYRIVPVVEYHNGTGLNDPAVLDEAVDFWIGEKEWLNDLERYVILNITNEWGKQNSDENGYGPSSYEDWAEEYKKAVTKLRSAGISNLLVIDSFSYGHSLKCILDYGRDIIDNDPMNNVLFSIHAYGGWYSSESTGVTNYEDLSTNRWDVNWSADHALDLLEEQKLPVIFGEFSRNCTLDVGGDCAPDDELIEDFNAHGAGWLFWMWWNWSGGSRVQMVNQPDSFSYTYSGAAVSGYMKGSQEATVFPDTPVPDLPEAGVPDPDWNPGPVYMNQRFNESWLQATIDSSVDRPGYMEIEFQDGGTREPMYYAGWGNAFYTKTFNESFFLGKSVRFRVHGADGSEAKTEFSELAYEKYFEIDAD